MLKQRHWSRTMDEYITLDNVDIGILMRNLNKNFGINSGSLAKKAIIFFKDNPDVLNNDQYIKIDESNVRRPEPGISYYNYVPMDAKYFINIKKTTFGIVLAILSLLYDENIFSKIIEMIFGNKISENIFHKINEDERCILLELLCKKEVSSVSNFNYENKECCANNIKCNYRRDGICFRNQNQTNEILNQLCEKGIVKFSNKNYRIIF